MCLSKAKCLDVDGIEINVGDTVFDVEFGGDSYTVKLVCMCNDSDIPEPIVYCKRNVIDYGYVYDDNYTDVLDDLVKNFEEMAYRVFKPSQLAHGFQPIEGVDMDDTELYNDWEYDYDNYDDCAEYNEYSLGKYEEYANDLD